MYQLKSLINKLEENLKEFNIFETIDIKTCNEAKYQFQINIKYESIEECGSIKPKFALEA